jgi:NTE family protein
MIENADRREIWLCLSGGNALGAYHAGVYRALEAAGVLPTRIAGASIGGIIGAIIAGNPPPERARQIDRFCRLATEMQLLPSWLQPTHSKIASVFRTFLHGRPGLFHPSVSQWWNRMLGLSSPSLFDRSPLRQTLPQFIDFERLNDGEIRFIVNAVDVETGEDIVFDTAQTRITIDHLMATTAFPLLYPPEEIDGRTLVDGGVSANLPLKALFDLPVSANVVCLAFDLVSSQGLAPTSLDDALNRAQDLVLSKQSEHMIQLVKHEFLARQAQSAAAALPCYSAAVLHTAYDGAGEVGGKALEFSLQSMSSRMEAGRHGGALAADWAKQHDVAVGSFLVERACSGSMRTNSAMPRTA